MIASFRQAMAELGMRFENYQPDRKPISVDDLASGLRNQGVNISKIRSSVGKAITKAESSGDDIATAISESVIKGLNINGVQDRQKISKFAAKYVSSLGESLDVNRLLEDLRNKGATPGQIARIFDQKQGVRISTLTGDTTYQEMLRSLENESIGASARGADIMNQGPVGAHNRLRGSYDNFILSLAESGVLDTVAKMLDTVASGLRSLSETNPKLLEFGTYAAAAGVALGPLTIAMRGVGMAADGVAAAMRLLLSAIPVPKSPVPLPTSAIPGVAGPVVAGLGVAAIGGIAYGLGAGVKYGIDHYYPRTDSESEDIRKRILNLETQIATTLSKSKIPEHAENLVAPLRLEIQDLRNRLGPSVPAFARTMPGGPLTLGGENGGLPRMAQLGNIPPLKGEVTGQARIDGTIKIEGTEYFRGIFTGFNTWLMELEGAWRSAAFNAGAVGGTGRSTPEAHPGTGIGSTGGQTP